MPPLNTLDKTLIAMALSQAAMASQAATITVSEACSLANAIRSANQSMAIGGCDTGSAGVNIIDLPVAQVITLSSIELDGAKAGPGGLPLIDSHITIQGNGSTIERSSAVATPEFRLFGLEGGSSLTIGSATLRNGIAQRSSGGYGGAFYVPTNASLTINDSSIVDNESKGYGGAIYFYAPALVEINRSNISGNLAANKGGALSGNFSSSPDGAALLITDSLLSKNVASSGQGGAVTLYGGLGHQVANSTISDNTALGGAGIYLNESELELLNTTVSNNHNTGAAGGVSIAGGSSNPPLLTLSNSVIAKSTNDGGANLDCSSTYSLTVVATASWVENIDGSCVGGGLVPSSITQGDPKLGSLTYNGGFTKSRAPTPQSGLLESGDASICASPPISGLDQLGAARGAITCTIGAVEMAAEENQFFVVPLKQGKSVVFSL